MEIGGKVQPFEAEKVLVAVGRRTDTEAFGIQMRQALRMTEVVSQSTIKWKQMYPMYMPSVVLVSGKVMLAHVASAQGEVAAENALGENAVYNGATNPSCVYTDPEFAGVGLTEEKAKEMGIAYQVGKFPLMANGKSLIMNGGVGSIKFIIGTESTRRFWGHILVATDSNRSDWRMCAGHRYGSDRRRYYCGNPRTSYCNRSGERSGSGSSRRESNSYSQ